MNAYHCKPATGPLNATVSVPGSKSMTNRALVLAALADGTSLLTGMLVAEDTRLMTHALRSLGIAITIDEKANTAEITGCGGQIPNTRARLDCGNSGTTIRFLSALCALARGCYELDGIGRMRERPIGQLAEVLASLGAGVEFPKKDGFPPITIHANALSGGLVSFHNPPSSQMVSALLMAAPYASGDVFIEVTGGLISQPYLTMTTAMMDAFGVAVLQQPAAQSADNARFIVAAPQRYTARTYTVEPDASSASYFLTAAAIAGGRVTVQGLGTGSLQGDASFVGVLEKMGCDVEKASDRLTVSRRRAIGNLHGVDVDLNDMPDMALTLGVAALFASGPTTIRNVASLRVKETDRLAALRAELTKLGATVETTDDTIVIEPPNEILPATVETYDDHRMAMSLALAGLGGAAVTLNNPGCCGKTFPDFFARFDAMLAQ